MLKIISSSNCGYLKSKCAEIHYHQTSNFSILCIFCGMTMLVYDEFLEHFQSHHFEDFAKCLHSTTEPVVVTAFEDQIPASKRDRSDPLEFGEREVTENVDEVMKKLHEDHLEMTQMKIEELQDTKGQHKSDGPFSDSDDEFLIRKLKIEESLLVTANLSNSSDSPKLQRNRKRCTKKISKRTSTHIDDYRSCSENDVDDNSDAAYSHPPTDEEDIDWSKPYEPNLLRNHEKRPYKPRNKPNVCSYCGRTFRRRYQLDTHLNIHTGSKPHQCEICGRLFRANTTLTRHLGTHEQREVFNCKFCEKAFTHKAALLSHESRHTQKRRIPCDECEKFFYTANQMDTHKRKVHHKADDILPFFCDVCKKRYRSASMLSTHKFKKHYKLAKFTCEQCDKKFIDEQQLETHKLIHIDGLTNLSCK